MEQQWCKLHLLWDWFCYDPATGGHVLIGMYLSFIRLIVFNIFHKDCDYYQKLMNMKFLHFNDVWDFIFSNTFHFKEKFELVSNILLKIPYLF